MLVKLFTEHPASVGETYFEHMGVAAGFAARMQLGAIVAFIHALLPFMFVKTGSNIIRGLFNRMIAARRNKPMTDEEFIADWVI